MNKVLTRVVHSVAACVLLGTVPALCQGVAPTPATETPRVAGNIPATATEQHPLIPVIRWAEKERPNVVAIQDYTATMQKQESINGTVMEAQVMEVKVRHQPFSVYIKFLLPRKKNGQQAIYVKGQNDNKLIAHGVGAQKLFGTQKLDPEGFLAMQDNKYPITEMGILNLIDKLLEVGYRDSKVGECTVTYTPDVKLSGRECTLIQVIHPVPRPHFMFNVARIFVDKEFNLPVRYESYEWPRKESEGPRLLEAYTYANLKINPGLTDADFDPANPAYNFPGYK